MDLYTCFWNKLCLLNILYVVHTPDGRLHKDFRCNLEHIHTVHLGKQRLVHMGMDCTDLWELVVVVLLWKCEIGNFIVFKFYSKQLRTKKTRLLTYRYWRTKRERISSKTFITRTYWHVIHYTAVSVRTARTSTWIFALLIDASKLTWTFWADDTFRSTVRWIAKIIGQTRASDLIANYLTLWIRTAWWWWAWQWFSSWRRSWCGSWKLEQNKKEEIIIKFNKVSIKLTLEQFWKEIWR